MTPDVSATSDRLRRSLANRYRLDRELGQGGMAKVYLAHDLKHERVMPFIAGETLRTRLERERQLPIDDAHHTRRPGLLGLCNGDVRPCLGR